jgi:ADP-ribosylglycohydrolase
VGSRFEFGEAPKPGFEFYTDDCSFTDDTVCTIAIADAIMNNKSYRDALLEWCRRYPEPMGGYGRNFYKWINSDDPQPYGSYGNGAAMRVSPVAWLFNEYDDVRDQSRLTAEPTHNHPEGIKGAKAVVSAIHDCLEMHGLFEHIGREQIMNYGLKRALTNYGYSIDFEEKDVQNRFDETCQGTVPVAFWVISRSSSFEDAIRRAVILGADADTLGAIVGSIAEAIWGIPEWMKQKALTYLPKDMREVLEAFRKQCPWRHTTRLAKKQEEQQKQQSEAIEYWTLGLGDSSKALSGGNPLPDKRKTATASSWKTIPMPEDSDEIAQVALDFWIPAAAMAIIRKGHIPAAMEDHWFMYCDEEYIRYCRSWTGICAFEAHYTSDGNDYRVDRLRISSDFAQYGANGAAAGAALFRYLVLAESGGNSQLAWQQYIEAKEKM